MRTRMAASLMVATFALAGCDQAQDRGGSSKPAPSASSGERAVCSSITTAEMSSAIGKRVVRSEQRVTTRCAYFTDDPLVYADLEVEPEGEAAWKGVNAGNTLIGAARDDLSAIGDQAFFGPRDRLYVLSKGTFLAIEAGFDNEVRDRAKRVATLVLSKLR